MPNEEHRTNSPDTSAWNNSRQLGIIDLFALLTLVALLCAMAAPIMRGMQTGNQILFLVIGLVEVCLTLGIYLWRTRLRRALLAKSGKRIGVGYCGQIRWRHWPVFKSILLMVCLAIVQLGIAMLTISLLILSNSDNSAPISPLAFLGFQLQPSFFMALALTRFIWRVYPNSLEFFEEGISLNCVSFIERERVEMRASQFFDDRVVVVVKQAPKSRVGETHLAQVAISLKVDLLSNDA